MTFWRRPLHAMTDAFTTAGFRLAVISEPQPDPAARLAVPSHDLGSSLSGLAGVGGEALGERGDEVAQFIGALDDERTVE